jgi:hypothetical protein
MRTEVRPAANQIFENILPSGDFNKSIGYLKKQYPDIFNDLQHKIKNYLD